MGRGTRTRRTRNTWNSDLFGLETFMTENKPSQNHIRLKTLWARNTKHGRLIGPELHKNGTDWARTIYD